MPGTEGFRGLESLGILHWLGLGFQGVYGRLSESDLLMVMRVTILRNNNMHILM